MKKRSKYKPKGVRLDTMSWVMAGLKVVSDVPDAGVMLKIKNHSAMADMVQGNATRDTVDNLIAAVNVAEALARLGVGDDWAQEIFAASDAIRDMAKRGIERDDKFLFTGPEMQAVNLLMDIHDAQLDNCTVKQMERALEMVEKEIRHKKARQICVEA